MCLGIPGRIISVGNDITDMATVDVCGVKRKINIALVCENNPSDLIGQWVLVHVGFAMSIINEEEAQATLDALANMSVLESELNETALHQGNDNLALR